MAQSKRQKLSLFLLAAVMTIGAIGVPFVRAVTCSTASECSAQISNLNSQNSQNQQALGGLQATASSYQDAINQLQSQINGLQAQISQSQATQARLQQQITEKQTEIDQNKQALGDDLRMMYVDGQMSTVEMLATSNNLSEYVDKQEYRNVVQSKIQILLTQIQALQAQLQQNEQQVTAALTAQQTQEAQVSSARAQQASLLAMNQSQQSQYNQQIASNKSSLTQLQAQLAILNTPKGSTVISGSLCGGSYPQSTPNPYGVYWGCNHSQDNTTDNWGMLNRECVSYTAYMVHVMYLRGEVKYDMPNWGGVGNAYQWISDAQSAGVPVDQTPKVGDIAIRPRDPSKSGDVGHAMYVESVSGSEIVVSQYNASYTGTYSMVRRSSAGLYFLHFQDWN